MRGYMNIKDLMFYGKEQLSENADAIIIIKILINHVFKITKEQIVTKLDEELCDSDVDLFKKAVQKVKNGIPVQYVTNHQEFMNLNFYVDENVLIPQPDTEIVVEEIINQFKDKNCKILDLCTGSGAIAISLAKYIENSTIVASDISSKAIQVAKLNAEKNLVHKKIEFIESDLFENINKKDFDVIVSNPPYIKSKEIDSLSKEVKCEPHIALDGGEDGLLFYKAIIEKSHNYLNKNGKLFLEIGYNQKEDVKKLLSENNNFYNIYSKKDLGQNDRIVVAEKRD